MPLQHFTVPVDGVETAMLEAPLETPNIQKYLGQPGKEEHFVRVPMGEDGSHRPGDLVSLATCLNAADLILPVLTNASTRSKVSRPTEPSRVRFGCAFAVAVL